MFRALLLSGFTFVCLNSAQAANGQHWGFEHEQIPGMRVQGLIRSHGGVDGQSIVFPGATVLTLDESEHIENGDRGFSLSVWVNPYRRNAGQQMIVCKNQYSLDRREWGVMLDKDNRFRLYLWQGKWVTVASEVQPKLGHWHLVGIVMRRESAELWVNGKLAGTVTLSRKIPRTAAPITVGAVDDNGRIWQTFHGAMDNLRLANEALPAKQMAALYHPVLLTHDIPDAPERFTLWSGPRFPHDPSVIPFVTGMKSSVIHSPRSNDHKFLHGAAIVEHKGVMYANWANSPTNENGPQETLRGKRSKDEGASWGDLEVIGPGFNTAERHSHGILFVHRGNLWTICARFGSGTQGRRFDGLKAEAFVLDEELGRWESRGIVMENCWPYDEPVRMKNGNYITGGQDRNGFPVVAISHGDDFTQWDSVLVPFDPALNPSFAETTVWADEERVTAVIRGGGGVAWVSTSTDFGRNWTMAGPSNFSMPRAKAYAGMLSNGQRYLLSNLQNRDTLVISVSRPGEDTLSSMYRIRHGKSVPPRYPGRAKSSQWSYPYGYEHNGKLYVVYSIGKEECGLSVIPLDSLSAETNP